MELRHIDIAHLSVASINMRGAKKAPDLTNILPSIRARGVLVPLIVRPTEQAEHYEIVAGKRRYHACLVVAAENDGIDPLPCAIMAPGDDAAALETSLIENIARLDPDEVTRWESFTRLVREGGRDPDDIATTFGLTSLQVKRTLALGNLLPRIRSLYRANRIDAVTLRHLTIANKARQREWLALVDDESASAPTGSALKAWLFGGSSIPTKAALFDLATYPGEIVADLFGEDSWFASSTDFWAAQRTEIEARVAAYREAGWSDVILLPEGSLFQTWEHQRCPKRKGGHIYVSVGHRGDVSFHEGYISKREAMRREKGEDSPKATRPEISSATAAYVDLHRHAMVRDALATRSMLALRVMVAHAIVGSPLWRVGIEPQRAPNDAVRESVETSAAEARFDAKHRAVLALLGFDPEAAMVVAGYDGDHGIVGLFQRLSFLSHMEVLDVLAIVMAETLDIGTQLIEALGLYLAVDPAATWQADPALLDGIRDRQVLNAMLAEVAGKATADAHRDATAKLQRQIIADCLSGSNGRTKVDGWVPPWMAFPPSAYTDRGNVPTASRWESIADILPTEQQAPARITASSLRIAA